MKIAIRVCRVVLGLGFAVFGANIVHSFMPQPPMDPSSLPGQFMQVMVPTHWMLVVGLFQLLGGVLVLLGRTAPLGLALLAPVLVNILCFHAFIMHGSGIGPGLTFTALELFLLYAYRGYFLPILTIRARPTSERP